MSGNNGSGRLPSLKTSNGAPSLKFKPKIVARRTKEERDASAPKIKKEETQKGQFDRRKNDRRPTNNQQRRVPRYLNNTHVISSGPLAAGNFASDKGSDFKRSFIKSEGGSSSLVHKGLQTIDTADVDSEEDNEDGIERKDDDNSDERKNKNKFNMGREYSVHQLEEEDDDEEFDSDVNMDDEAWQAKKVEELFPVRPIRIRHDDLETVQKEIKDSLSEGTTREPTPMIQIKQEDNGNAEMQGTELQKLLKSRESSMNEKIEKLSLQDQFRSLDEKESLQEIKNLTEDHTRIWRKLNRINNKPKRFVLFQLPSKLPGFEEITPKNEKQGLDEKIPQEDNLDEEESASQDQDPKKETQQDVLENGTVPQNLLTGRIGSIRVHKSGRLSVKIGNVTMDISRGAETTFLQDIASLNENDENPSVEILGRLDGRMVVTPKL